RDQLLRLMGGKSQRERETSDEAFLRSLLAAYPDRLAKAREAGSRRGLMVGGRGVRLADAVAVGDEELFLCIDPDGAAGDVLVRQASAIDRAWLDSGRLVTDTVVEFDEMTGKVIARRRVSVDGLTLEEVPAASPSGDEVAMALATAASSR